MALYEVDVKTADKRSYMIKMLDEFLASDMDAALVDVPENIKPQVFRCNMYGAIKRRELLDEVVVRMAGGNVYLLRK